VPLRIYPGEIKTRLAWHEVPGKKEKDASKPVGTVYSKSLTNASFLRSIKDDYNGDRKGIQLIKSGSSAWIHQTFRGRLSAYRQIPVIENRLGMLSAEQLSGQGRTPKAFGVREYIHPKRRPRIYGMPLGASPKREREGRRYANTRFAKQTFFR
jgi:hypothetical protein